MLAERWYSNLSGLAAANSRIAAIATATAIKTKTNTDMTSSVEWLLTSETSPGDKRAHPTVAQVETAPCEHSDVDPEQHMGEQRAVDAQMRIDGTAEIAGEQDGAEHR